MNKFTIVVAILLGSASVAAMADSKSITSVAAIHVLTNAQASQHLPVKFEATITYHRGYEKTLFVQDGDTAIYVQDPTGSKLALGDRILVEGTTHESFRPFVLASNIKVLGHGQLPKAVPASFDDLIHSSYDCRLVTVRAIVRTADILNHSARNSSMQMLADGGNIDATVDTTEEDALKDLLDAEVEVTGVASGRFDGKMQKTGILIHVSSMAGVRLIKRATRNPWSLPVTPMDEILSGYHINNLTERVRVNGTITYYQPGSAVVLQMGTKSLWVRTQARNDLSIGDIANAIGIPDVHDGFLTLTQGEIQDSGLSAPVYPHTATWSDLTQSHHIFDLVSVQGRVMMEAREAAQDEYVLLADGHLFSAIVRHPVATNSSLSPPSLPQMKKIPLGATIQVTGICILEDSNPFDVQVPFNIMMRSADDMTVIVNPSWLTVTNLMQVVSALLVIVLAVGAWGWTQRRKVQLQTAKLAARAAAEAAMERKYAELQTRRSKILENINGAIPLVDVLQEITDLLSFSLDGVPCWCEITDGGRLGTYPGEMGSLRIVYEDIPSRTGPPLGVLFAGLASGSSSIASEKEAFFMGSRLATLAIETRKLYTDLVHRSEFDLLTDIHNRFSLDNRLEALIASARDKADVFGLIYVDLDEFKQVNDLYGHHVGDLYLQEVSLRMKRQLRSGDLLARLGGDEFAVLVPAARSRAGVEEIALRLEQSFKEPFVVDCYVLAGSASVGIALYPEDGSTRDSLLSAADAAMYVSKHSKQDVAEMPASGHESSLLHEAS